MSFKMAANAWYTELCEYEKEINSSWYWKLRSKRKKLFLLKQIEFHKSRLSMSMKLFDCLVKTTENS